MADGFLESHYAEYEKKKAAWLKRKQSFSYQHRNLLPKQKASEKPLNN